MRIETIKSLEEIRKGTFFYQKEKGKEYEIGCYEGSLRIRDFQNLISYYKTTVDNSVTVLKNILEKYNTIDIEEVIKVLPQEEFEHDTFKKSNTFNPFFKRIEGELEIKLKAGTGRRLTKTQIKKILSHVDTIGEIESSYSDDYAYDYAMNYFKGVKMTSVEIMYDVINYFNSAFVEKSKEVILLVAGYSKTIIIKNPNLKFIEV
ncbi:MAG: hypothetical protein IAA47_08170 [Candidatus Fusobacterium pullicola]|uniref:Uncharacterized protein n=1 Tax=Candidatus Fusobacterium pullicola TaxID=2838601 RepID=A0A9E2NXP5_9FUSO|nr:hypothetical protein [Candidatus Fusobacterium pullicola]